MAPAPFPPLNSTPAHCDTIHWQFKSPALKVMVSGPLPGAALIARKIVRRLRGVLSASKVTLATCVQAVIPPPDSVGLGGAIVELPSTATVMSVLGAGAMTAVV